MKNVKLGAALLGLLAVAAGPAAAQSKDDDKGIYLGGSGGLAHFTKSCVQSNVPCEDKDPAFRVFGGYRFNKYWGAEISYFDLGASKGEGVIGGQTATFKYDVYGADAVATATVQVAGRLHAYGKLGIYLARVTMKQELGGVVVQSSGGTNHNYTVGAGLQYNLGPLGIQLGWQRYNNTGGPEDQGTLIEDDVDVYGVGLLWRF